MGAWHISCRHKYSVLKRQVRDVPVCTRLCLSARAFYCLINLLKRRLSLHKLGGSRGHDGNCNECCTVGDVYKIGEVYFHLIGTHGFHIRDKKWKIYCCGLVLSPEPSRNHLADYVKRLYQRACRTCSTILFSHVLIRSLFSGVVFDVVFVLVNRVNSWYFASRITFSTGLYPAFLLLKWTFSRFCSLHNKLCCVSTEPKSRDHECKYSFSCDPWLGTFLSHHRVHCIGAEVRFEEGPK